MSQQPMTMQYQFDARQYDPTQGTPTHPPGKYQATISDTQIKPTKDNDGGYFEVTFKTPVGQIAMRYNLWNTNAQAVDIAHRQLSALCHAVNIFNVDMNNAGAALRGQNLQIEVGLQKGEKEGGYTEMKRVYDAAGNEPGKGGQAAQPQQANNGFGGQPAQNAQPQQQPQQGFGGQPQQAPAAGQGWGNTAPAPQQDQQPQQQPPANGWGGGQATQPAQAPAGPAAWNQQPAAPAGNGAAPWGGQR